MTKRTTYASFYLASSGVYIAPVVANRSVSSYLALSTLPYQKINVAVHFCCTFLEVTFTGSWPALCSAMLGLSSWISPRNHLANSTIFYTDFYFCQEYFYIISKKQSKLIKKYENIQKIAVFWMFFYNFWIFGSKNWKLANIKIWSLSKIFFSIFQLLFRFFYCY